MSSKDNENPVIHSTAASQLSASRSAKSNKSSEWWRDNSLHTNPVNVFGNHLGDENDDDEEDDDNDDDEITSSEDGKVPGSEKSHKEERIDAQEVYDLIRSISDPEHPLTLEQLAVVNASHITVDEQARQPHILLEFTPTIPHCSMATLIGLSLRVRLLRSLPPRYKLDIKVRSGTHQSEHAVNKQLNDKERVAAALENAHLLDVVQTCLKSAGRRGRTNQDGEIEIEGGDGWEEEIERVAREMGVQV